MNKKIGFLWICLCLSLCGCQRETGENESVSREETADEEGQIFLDKYNEVIVQEDAKRAALIYLDEDSVPELLILKNGEYKLYSFDGSEVRALVLSDGEIKANAYGPVHDFEESEYQTFYWFEYVPYEGLIRVHSGQNQERHDYYLKYADGLFSIELETKSVDFAWYTYDGEKEITNEEFLSSLSALGYGKLIPCSYLYEDVTTAYKNISAVPADTQRVLEDFVSGKTDALDYVVEIGDIPEDGFVMRSYEDFYDDITGGEDEWGSVEYIDFDNDGDRELILHGYTGACLFFDVTGDRVYKVLRTGSTTDVASVVEIEGRKAIQRTDLTHGGRKSYRIMKFDSCCCLIDWFHLYAEYEGTDYTEEDRFTYRNREISMEEYEAILEGLHQ